MRGSGVREKSLVLTRGPSNCFSNICRLSGSLMLILVTTRLPSSHPVAVTLVSPRTMMSVQSGTEGRVLASQSEVRKDDISQSEQSIYLASSGTTAPGSTSMYMCLAVSSL